MTSIDNAELKFALSPINVERDKVVKRKPAFTVNRVAEIIEFDAQLLRFSGNHRPLALLQVNRRAVVEHPDYRLVAIVCHHLA